VAEPQKRITVRVSETLHRKVKARAALVGKSVSDVLREYLEEWTGDIEPPAIRKQEEQPEQE
jgi:Arc/MetJ-type ribon-helix-helix transcriptional regulator